MKNEKRYSKEGFGAGRGTRDSGSSFKKDGGRPRSGGAGKEGASFGGRSGAGRDGAGFGAKTGAGRDAGSFGGRTGGRTGGGKSGFGGKRRDEEGAVKGGFGREIDRDSFNEKERDALTSEDMLEGRNPVIEALKAGRAINKILISKGDVEGSIKQIIGMARDKGIVTQEVDRAKLDAMSMTKSHQGVIAMVAMKEYVEVEDILARAKEKGEDPFIIILDEIADPHNLGSILRTADAAGAHGVIIPKRRAVGLTSTVAKASAGAIEYVPVARVTNIAQTIEMLKKNEIWVAGTDSTGESFYYQNDLKGPIALVIGSEGEGMSKLIREKCDFVVKIPMKGSVSSLNASVAASVIMYEIMKQRGAK